MKTLAALDPDLDYPCGTCDKWRDGCDFCLGTNNGDGSREDLAPLEAAGGTS